MLGVLCCVLLLHACCCMHAVACRLPVYATKEELTIALRKNFGPFGQIESVKAALAHTPWSAPRVPLEYPIEYPSSTPRVPLEFGQIGSVTAAHTPTHCPCGRSQPLWVLA
jgi:hypothetical protein